MEFDEENQKRYVNILIKCIFVYTYEIVFLKELFC